MKITVYTQRVDDVPTEDWSVHKDVQSYRVGAEKELIVELSSGGKVTYAPGIWRSVRERAPQSQETDQP